MKKLVAVLALLVVSSVSLSAHAACGNNTSRTAPTRAPGSSAPGTAGSPSAGGAVGAGIPR